jgi:hypothetical protein
LNYDIGHAVHGWWQNHYLAHLEGDFTLWGHWKCNRCQNVTPAIQMKPADCETCSGPPSWTYEEVTVREDTLRLTGHPDSLLGGAHPEIVNEIKTIGSDRFDKLTGPMEEHRVQVHAYMAATGLRRSMYCYVDKGKQSLWRMVDGEFEIYGDPRVKFFYEDFDDALWAKITEVVQSFWTVVEGLPK